MWSDIYNEEIKQHPHQKKKKVRLKYSSGLYSIQGYGEVLLFSKFVYVKLAVFSPFSY